MKQINKSYRTGFLNEEMHPKQLVKMTTMPGVPIMAGNFIAKNATIEKTFTH